MARATAVALGSSIAAAGGAQGSALAAPAASAPEVAATVTRTTVTNRDLRLPALIAQPSSSAARPAPAVVLLHGCRGLWSPANGRISSSHVRRWLRRLAAEGYFAIAPDSFGPRGVRAACGRGAEAPNVAERVGDAFAALSHLRELHGVADSRVAVLGWSSGGRAARAAVRRDGPVSRPSAGGFRTAVAFRRARGADATAWRALAAGLGRKPSDESSGGSDGTGGIFAPDSWPRQPLADDAPLDPNQLPALGLRSQIREFGTWVNTVDWSSPVYVVGPDQRTTDVGLDSQYTGYNWTDREALRRDMTAVPIPDGAFPSGPWQTGDVWWSDKEMIIHQPSTDTAWELYHATNWGSQWWVTDGGKITNVSRSQGGYDPWPSGKPHGLTGAGLPLLTGLQRLEELQRGSIDHAVLVSIPHARKDVFRSPALKTDGGWTTWDAVPEGARFRLPAHLNLDLLPLTPYARMVGRAIQRYGLIVVDRNCRPSDTKRCPAVTFKAESPRPVSPDPYAPIFGGVARHHLFDNFPWDQLQLLPEE